MSKPQFIVIPEIAGRLIVGTTPNGYETALRSEIGVTHLIDVTPDAEIAQDDNWWYEAQGPDDDNARRVATLRWYMKESSLAGTVFYIFSDVRAWQTAALALMARYSWTAQRTRAILEALSGLDLDLTAVELAFKTYLEQGNT